MGHSASKQTTPTKTFSPTIEVLDVEHSTQLGEVRLVKNTQNGQEMYLKTIVLHDQESFDKHLLYYFNRLNNPHRNLINVVGYTSEQQHILCADNYTIHVFHDPLAKNLESEFKQHMVNNELFSEIQLQLMTEHLISALAEFQKKGLVHGEIQPSNVFVTEESYKLCDPSFDGQKSANGIVRYYLLGVKPLLAPEVLKQVPLQDYEIRTNQFKADVFSLGALILSLATLVNSEELYNYDNGTMDLEDLEARLKFVEQTYSPTFSKLLRELLTVDENARPDFLQLSDRLHIGDVVESYNYKAQVQSYAKVPYVKIINNLTAEYSNFTTPLPDAETANGDTPLKANSPQVPESVQTSAGSNGGHLENSPLSQSN